jgi:RND family efflux transporter MFP subunit
MTEQDANVWDRDPKTRDEDLGRRGAAEPGPTSETGDSRGFPPEPDRKRAPDDDSPDATAPEPGERDAEAGVEQTPGIPWVGIFVAIVLVTGLLGWGVYGHWRENAVAAQTQQDTINFVPTVQAASAKREDAPVSVTLPGQTEAFNVAQIYARATGYITERHVDIGSRVKKGDPLVHIAAPDLDQQLEQAVAQLGQVQAALAESQAQVSQAQANLELQQTNLRRANALTQKGFETLQNQQTQQTTVASNEAALVTARASVKVGEANVKAQQAAVDRLRALAAFENVVAPFDGVVTARNVEVGDLVNADSGSGTAMFTVEDDQVLRIQARVPQYSAQGLTDGLEAQIDAPDIPGRSFFGRIARNSVALLYSTRTLTTEVDVPNEDGALRPGLFVNVTFHIPRAQPDVSIPADALIFNQHGMQVAVVEPDDRVKMQKVNIYRDLGASVELNTGLNGGEKVVTEPPVDLRDGQKVTIAANGDGGPTKEANAGTRN